MTQLSIDDQSLIAGYVLGDLEPEEMAQIEQRLAADPDLMAEVNAMQVSLWLTPQGMPLMTPPSPLKDKILTAYMAENSPERAPARTAIAPPISNEIAPPIAPPEPLLRSRPFPWAKLLAALAAAVALYLGADNFRLRHSLSLAEAATEQIKAQQAERDRLAAILQRPNSRLVALKGAAGDAAGTLLFTPGQWKEVVVSLGNLPPLPPDQIYRMWLTLANGDTIPCGEFNTDDKGAVFVKLNPPKTPPKGVKATGIYVTVDGVNTPLNPEGDRVMSGSI
jgi:anti-sigma factor RsiW